MQGRGDDAGDDDSVKLRVACVAPDAAVELHAPEDHYADDGVDRNEFEPRVQIDLWDHGIVQIEAQPKGEEIGEIDRKDVIQEQNQGNSVPWFKVEPFFSVGICIHCPVLWKPAVRSVSFDYTISLYYSIVCWDLSISMLEVFSRIVRKLDIDCFFCSCMRLNWQAREPVAGLRRGCLIEQLR